MVAPVLSLLHEMLSPNNITITSPMMVTCALYRRILMENAEILLFLDKNTGLLCMSKINVISLPDHSAKKV